MKGLVDVLKDNGYQVAEGAEAVLQAIQKVSNGPPTKRLCSGYRVFPNGNKCPGCSDCEMP
jgi:hypothetical protein